jgi:hypothetical protein
MVSSLRRIVSWNAAHETNAAWVGLQDMCVDAGQVDAETSAKRIIRMSPLSRRAAMRRIAILSVVAALATVVPAGAASLDGLRWKNRVLVLVAPSAQDDQLQAQRRLLQAASGGMRERDIVVMDAIGDGQQARELRKRSATDGRAFRIVLIGKDGNTAFASNNPLTAQDIFGRIDAMPMRRDEMRNRRMGG